MLNFVELEKGFKEIADLRKRGFYLEKPGYSEEEISNEEERLGMKMADDYRQFLKEYHTFALSDSFTPKKLADISERTSEFKDMSEEIGRKFPKGMYALGCFDPECPVFLQDSKGTVYEYDLYYKYAKPIKKAGSLLEFMNLEYERMMDYLKNK